MVVEIRNNTSHTERANIPRARKPDRRIINLAIALSAYKVEEDKFGMITVEPKEELLVIGKRLSLEESFLNRKVNIEALTAGLDALGNPSALSGIGPEIMEIIEYRSCEDLIKYGKIIKGYLTREQRKTEG